MNINPVEMLLSESYELKVLVPCGENNFMGLIKMNPYSITLQVNGEESLSRKYSYGFENIEKLECAEYINGRSVILYGLEFKGGSRSRITSPSGDSVVHFKAEYEASYSIIGFFSHPNYQFFSGISVSSKCIREWASITKRQQNILLNLSRGEGVFDQDEELLCELSRPIGDDLFLSVDYSPSASFSLDDLSCSNNLHISMNLLFCNGLSSAEVYEKYLDLYSLMFFVMGGHLDIEKILIHGNYNREEIFLFYPQLKRKKVSQNNYKLFPLGKDLFDPSLGLPAFPDTAIENYFLLNRSDREIFYKYLRYRGMESAEERYLGFFRLLERLCHVRKNFVDPSKLDKLIRKSKPFLTKYFDGDTRNITSLLAKLKHSNKNKYNTLSCMQKFYARFPEGHDDKLMYNKDSLVELCKLRNDITHANDTEIEQLEMEGKTTFIEMLLVYALFEKIGIGFEITKKIIYRMHGFSRIRNHEPVVWCR